jgi:lipopolysaccharide export system permease protein
VTLLDRYLIKQFLSNMLLVLGSLVAIYLLVDFFERIDDFMEAKKSIGLAATYFLLKIPFIIDQLLPVCILLAGIITIGLLYRNRELMSLHAGGINIFRISFPLLFISGCMTLVALANAQWVFPQAVTASETIWQEEVKKKVVKGIVRHGRIFYKGKEGIYSFSREGSTRQLFHDFNYTVLNENNQLILFLTAKTATWDQKGWIFANGQQKILNENASYTIDVFSNKEIQLPDNPEDFFMPPYHGNQTSISQLLRQWFAGNTPEAHLAMIEANKRLSFIFLGIPLLILAIPIMLFMHGRLKGDLAITIPSSCGLAFGAWALWNGGQALSHAGQINPVPASWSIHIILAASGFFLLWKQNNI